MIMSDSSVHCTWCNYICRPNHIMAVGSYVSVLAVTTLVSGMQFGCHLLVLCVVIFRFVVCVV